MNIFFTSDIHLFHKNILKFESLARPFSTIEEMHQVIEDNWNSKVSDKDIVYVGGDISFGKVTSAVEILNRLNGTKILTPGNHDDNHLKHASFRYCFHDIKERIEIKYNKILYTISHYPQLSWNKSHIENVSFFLFGHEHSRFLGYHNMLNIGMDCHNLTPIHIDEIPDKLKLLPANPNVIRPIRSS